MNSYRSVLEVLKFASPLQALSSASQTSQAWSSASNSAELWYLYLSCIQVCPPSASPPCPKQAFQALIRPQILLCPHSLAVYGCYSQRWRSTLQFTELVQANENSSFALFPPHSLLIAGGGPNYAWNSAYSFDLTTAHVSVLRTMTTARRSHGLVYYDMSVYAFGGANVGILRSSEVYDIEGNQWTPGYQMAAPRCLFVPCEHTGRIYLCGGMGTQQCEAYSPRTHTGVVLGLVLPEEEATCCVVSGGTLVVISRRFVTEAETGEGREVKASRRRAQASEPQGNMVATIVGKDVFLGFGKYIQRIDLSTTLCHYLDYIW